MIALHLAFSLIAAYVLVSQVEYWLHREPMHHMKFAKRMRSEFLRQLCFNHMALHHKKGYEHEPDEDGGYDSDHHEDDKRWQISLAGLIPNVIFCALLWLVDPISSVTLFVVGTVYGIVWWEVHNEMHRRQGRAISRTAWFRYIEGRHRLHHKYPNTNYNLILPLCDWLFGTEAPAQQLRPVRQVSSK
jgi:sterol desaturase/sphingolipid hydroxylase (fatty acid hydroxylase superfamily)